MSAPESVIEHLAELPGLLAAGAGGLVTMLAAGARVYRIAKDVDDKASRADLEAVRQQMRDGRRELEAMLRAELNGKADVAELVKIREHLATTREEVASLKAFMAARFDGLEDLLRSGAQR